MRLGMPDDGKCYCLTCDNARREVMTLMEQFENPRLFIVCDVCGNKRCPKATHHDNECTGSNEPGQVGSAYY